jgi:tetratricopeptide (TPR) repeat protein
MVLAGLFTGCAAVKTPPRTVVTSWPYGEFDHTRTEIKSSVKETLRVGDLYRNLAHKALSNLPPNWPYGYWYAEESKKFYNHVLDELEPHNAYAAVNIGYLALIRSRAAISPKEKEVLQSAAASKFMLAQEKRKGYKEAVLYMGELYALQKRWSDAEREFRRLYESGIENAYIHSWWGYVLLKQGRRDDAKVHLRKAVEDGDPEQSATWARRHL